MLTFNSFHQHISSLSLPQLYRQVLSLRPDFVEAYINRAEVLLELNRTKEAFALYAEALKQDSENADVHYNVSNINIQE